MIGTRLQKLLSSKQDVNESIVRLMKYFGWTIEDIRNLPIPSYIELVKQVNKIEAKDNPKGRR